MAYLESLPLLLSVGTILIHAFVWCAFWCEPAGIDSLVQDCLQHFFVDIFSSLLILNDLISPKDIWTDWKVWDTYDMKGFSGQDETSIVFRQVWKSNFSKISYSWVRPSEKEMMTKINIIKNLATSTTIPPKEMRSGPKKLRIRRLWSRCR